MKRIALGSLALLFAAGAANADPLVRGDRTTSRFVLLGASTSYEATDLGTLGGAVSSGVDLNANGHVVGWAQTVSQMHGFFWSPATGMVDLGDFGGGTSSAMGINDNDQVAGWAVNSFNQAEAFIWTASTGLQRIGYLGCMTSSPWDRCSAALDINNLGQVVGWTITPSGNAMHAFLWTASGGMQDLGTLGGAMSVAWGINDLGEVVGVSVNGLGEPHAFLWTSSDGMQDLGTLGGVSSIGQHLNGSAWVVGQSHDGSTLRPFLWASESGMLDLGTLQGSTGTGYAYGINGSGEIVGVSQDADNVGRPTRWAEGGVIQDLGTLGGSTGTARSVNGNGVIAGFSVNADNVTRATLWTPSTTSEEPPPVACGTSMLDKIGCLRDEILAHQEAGVLNRGQAKSMLVKLDAAEKQLQRSDPRTAANILRALSKQVTAFLNASILSMESSGMLVELSSGFEAEAESYVPKPQNEGKGRP